MEDRTQLVALAAWVDRDHYLLVAVSDETLFLAGDIDLEPLESSYTLHSYAATHWTDHAELAGTHADPLFPLVIKLFQPKPF